MTEELMEKNIPIIVCEEYNGQWRFWCPFCKKWHYHGAEPGHRVAHCGSDSPFRETGYILRLKKRGEKR
jgi:hypothetical protein